MKWIHTALVGVLSLVMVAMSGAPAHAAPAGAAHQDATVVSGPMILKQLHGVLGGFDPAIATAHGYTVRTDAAGKPYAWKPGYVLHHAANGLPFAVPAPTGATPNTQNGDYVWGNCGYSYIYFNASGGLTGFVYTGFGGQHAGLGGALGVQVSDSAGTGDVTRNFGAKPASFGYNFYTLNHAGYAEAEVMPYSFVFLNNGNECFSGGSMDSTTITD